jgi:hypothetical protein
MIQKKRVANIIFNLLYTINHISEKWNNDTKGIIYFRREFDWFKTCNEHNLNKTTHALDKLYIRMMAFYGIPMKHLQEKTGFICLKLEKYRTFFIPYFSYSNFVLF